MRDSQKESELHWINLTISIDIDNWHDTEIRILSTITIYKNLYLGLDEQLLIQLSFPSVCYRIWSKSKSIGVGSVSSALSNNVIWIKWI